MAMPALDHLQVAMPRGEEARARIFYGNLLGLQEQPKPEPLRGRGGLWFVLAGGVGFHLGVEEDFRPARKAHPALRCADFCALLVRLAAAGVATDAGVDEAGRRRAYLHDPFGNRLELIEDA